MAAEAVSEGAKWGLMFKDIIMLSFGAALATGGGFLGNYLNQKMNAKGVYRKLRRDKLEELVTATTYIMGWFDNYQYSLFLYNKPMSEKESPVNRVEMISLLYFEELHEDVSDLLDTFHTLCGWAISTYQDRLRDGNTKVNLSPQQMYDRARLTQDLFSSISKIKERSISIGRALN